MCFIVVVVYMNDYYDGKPYCSQVSVKRNYATLMFIILIIMDFTTKTILNYFLHVLSTSYLNINKQKNLV